MADLNQEQIAELSESFRRLADVLDPYRQQTTEAERAMAEYEAQVKKTKDAQEKFTKNLVTGATDFAKKLAQSNGEFDSLNKIVDITANAMGGLLSVIPVVGGALQGLAKGSAETAKFMVDQFQIGFNAYKELADIGLATSFEDMRESAAVLDLKFEDVGKALKTYSTDIATFGGTTITGVKRFAQLSSSLVKTRDQFRSLGINAEEFAVFQAKFLSQESRRGRLQGQTADQLREGTRKYIEELDTLSKLTGVSRKDLQAQRDAALSESRFAAATSLLGKKVEQTALDLNTLIISKGGPALAQGFRDLLSGAVTTDAAKALVTQTGGQAQEIIAQVRAGTITASDAFNKLSKSFDPKTMAQFAQYVGDSSIASQNYAEAQKLASAAAITPAQVKEIEKEREDLIKGRKKETTSLASAERNLYNTSKNIQLMATSSETVTKSLNLFSKVLDETVIKMSEITGTELPASLKARREERKQLEITDKIRKKLQKEEAADARETDPTSFRSKFRKRRIETLKKQLENQERKSSAATSALETAEAEYAGGFSTQIQNFEGLRIKSDESIGGGEASTAAISLARQVQKALGNDLVRFTAFNDRYHQENSPASLHTQGKAFDFTIRDPLNSEKVSNQIRGMDGVAKVIDEYKNPSSNSTGGHIHVEVRRFGGPVASGKQYLVGEEGPEIITPNTSGTVTPNSVFDGGFKILGDKLDRVADLLNDGNTTRKKQLQRAMS